MQRATRWVLIGLVVEGHRPQVHECAARGIHVLDVVLEAAGRGVGAKSAVGFYIHGGAVDQCRGVVDAADIRKEINTELADANGAAFPRRSVEAIADVDVVAAGNEVLPRVCSYGDVTVASRAADKRGCADRNVKEPGRVGLECAVPVGCVQLAGGVCIQRSEAAGGI